MHRSVHLGWCLLAGLLLGAAGGVSGCSPGVTRAHATYPPPGLVSWDSRTVTLQAGESVQFEIDFAQIPVRRWLLLVEGDVRRSYLNLRRVADGSLVYDQRNEARHLATVPWGEDEVLSGMLMAGRHGGAFTISFWGPPPDAYLRAYRYEVNRALEALAEGRRGRAASHLQKALQERSDDRVARVLLLGLAADQDGTTGLDLAATAPLDSLTVLRYAEIKRMIDSLHAQQQIYAAVDTLQERLVGTRPPLLRALLHTELARLFLELGNAQQAAIAIEAAADLWLGDQAESNRR